MLLSAAVFDQHSPGSASTAASPSTAGLFTPSVFASVQPTDYFNSKPRTPLTATLQRPSDALRTRAPSAGRGPSGSRDHQRSESRDQRSESRNQRSESRTETQGHLKTDSRGHYRSTSRDYRSTSRDHRSTSRDHIRSESTSSRLDNQHHHTPPRTRERRDKDKDKKTMLSRALQKANTAVLLDNAQNFEGAMEAYEDACKLLQHVMIRSSQDEDRRKLDAIVSCIS